MFTPAAERAPFQGQVRPPLPTPMEDEDNNATSRTTACVPGGASAVGSRRYFLRPQHGGTLNSKALAAAGGVANPARSKVQRGLPLVQWAWPANSRSALARVGSEWFRGATGSVRGVAQENPTRLREGRTQKSSVVVGTVCEPVRPTRLELSEAQGERDPWSSSVCPMMAGPARQGCDILRAAGALSYGAGYGVAARYLALRLEPKTHSTRVWVL